VGEGGGWAQVRYPHWALERPARRDDLAVDSGEVVGREGPRGTGSADPRQYFSFPVRGVGPSSRILGCADALGQTGALVEQADDLLVEPIDLATCRLERVQISWGLG
jgi:hypothetical protein